MGLPTRTYQHFESGRTYLDLERLIAFAEATDSDACGILAAVLMGSPMFAVRSMDNKLMSVLLGGAQRLNERLGDDLSRLEVGRLIAAVRKVFDELEAELAARHDEAQAWLNTTSRTRPAP